MNRLILVGAVGLAIAAGAIFMQTRSAPSNIAELPAGAANAQEASDIDTSSVVEMTMGPEDAKVTVIEYASFTCPHCARFHTDQFKQLKADYIDTNQVHFIYRDVFFDRFGLWASMVARCGGEERFFGLTDMIYAQQSDWIGSGQDPVQIANNLRNIGKVAGLDDAQLEACLNDSEKAEALVAWFQVNAEADDVSATPTVIINGQRPKNNSYSELKALIDEKLAE
ncbi:DsbA family protein [Roseovarius sp. 2305UL8-3]|uniref:DsbA family protein n=1 Tax=Roseovarius conchicola TaxID=3121636 RepID=UPI003526CF75